MSRPSFDALPHTPEYRNVDHKTFHDVIVPKDRPAVLKGLISDWSVVQAAKQSPQALSEYLKARTSGQPTTAFVAPAHIRGVFHYRDDMTGLNFERRQQPLHLTAASILAHLDKPFPPAIYAPAALTDMPLFTEENRLSILEPSVGARLWLGNAVTAPTHYDMQDGLACVAAGRRRFTFFPPEQLPNLYVGPLDMAPGGLPTSLVKVSAPDMERYPRYAEALATAEVAELEPGDAVFIPNMWWHNVESLDGMNLLVNYWWSEYPHGPVTPFAALALGLMSVSPLPPNRRQIWRQMFDHYVFRTHGDPVPYLPPDKRGMLGEMNPQIESYMRTQIVRALIRTLPEKIREQIERWVSAAGPSSGSDQSYN